MNAWKRFSLFLALGVLTGAAGCFSSREEVKQVDANAGFVFLGHTENVLVSVLKDGQPVWTDLAIEKDTRYTIQPGVYEVVVMRNGMRVVHRKVFLDDGSYFEIRIP